MEVKNQTAAPAGRGTKRFEKEEADQLVQELNHEYPEIEHEAVLAVDEPAAELVIPDPSAPILSLA